MEPVTPQLDELACRARSLVDSGGRILGIAGAPGSGKSTLADDLVARIGAGACLLPMDGFHLADDELRRRGLQHRKGAPDTFDVEGYLHTLRRVRDRQVAVLAPRFDRELEAAIAGSICVDPSVDLVITDGNYLLVRDGRWKAVARLLDECWMLELADHERRRRLIARHEQFGRSPDDARRWVSDVDDVNADVVRLRSAEPNLVVAIA